MPLFRNYNEDDAIKQINSINKEMRAINAQLHLAGGDVAAANREVIIKHLQAIVRYGEKYDKIKKSFSSMDYTLFLGATVDAWNGEQVGVFTWEIYFKRTIDYLFHELNL